jgi:hypothetical protein
MSAVTLLASEVRGGVPESHQWEKGLSVTPTLPSPLILGWGWLVLPTNGT